MDINGSVILCRLVMSLLDSDFHFHCHPQRFLLPAMWRSLSNMVRQMHQLWNIGSETASVFDATCFVAGIYIYDIFCIKLFGTVCAECATSGDAGFKNLSGIKVRKAYMPGKSLHKCLILFW